MKLFTVSIKNGRPHICYWCLLAFTIRNMNKCFAKKKKRDMNKCNHACHVAYMLSLEVQNTVIRVKPVLKKILETSMHHLLQVKGHL